MFFNLQIDIRLLRFLWLYTAVSDVRGFYKLKWPDLHKQMLYMILRLEWKFIGDCFGGVKCIELAVDHGIGGH